MKRIYLLMVLLIYCLTSYQQIAFTVPSSVSAANTSVADNKNRTPFHNPACFSYDKHPILVTEFASQYILKSLSTKSITATYPTKYFTSGLAFYHYGFSAFHEMNAGLLFARNFSNKFSIGLQFNYHTAYLVQSNTYKGMIYPQIGLQLPMGKRWLFGCHIFNPFASDIRAENRNIQLPSVYSAGLSYAFAPGISWRLQMDKELRSAYRLASAFDYQFTKLTRFQVGVSYMDYLVSSLALGLNLSSFSFDVATELHSVLGLNVISQVKLHIPYK